MSKPFMWFLGALLLVILADFAPKVSVWLILLLVTGVLVMNANAITTYFTPKK